MILKSYYSHLACYVALIVSLLFINASMAANGGKKDTVMIGSQEYSVATWKKEAKDGKPFPQFMLGVLYLNGNGVSKDANLGVEYLKKSAEQGWKGSLELLCYLYVFGDADNNVEKDFVEAKKWCEIAASKDIANAYYNLGVMHNNGLGVEKNKSKAKAWFGQACNNGVNAGCDEYKKTSQ
ncbi:TPA: tetratricopeptide repeat protein [Providencia rettgeri]